MKSAGLKPLVASMTEEGCAAQAIAPMRNGRSSPRCWNERRRWAVRAVTGYGICGMRSSASKPGGGRACLGRLVGTFSITPGHARRPPGRSSIIPQADAPRRYPCPAVLPCKSNGLSFRQAATSV